MNLMSYVLLTVLILIAGLFAFKSLGDVLNQSFEQLNDRISVVEQLQKERK